MPTCMESAQPLCQDGIDLKCESPEEQMCSERMHIKQMMARSFPPGLEDTLEAGNNILAIATLKFQSSAEDAFDRDLPFLDLLLDTWNDLVRLIRRRIFMDKESGVVFINLKEIDYLHADAFISLKLGAMFPIIDFDLVTGLGNLLCEIYENLSKYIDNRLVELDGIKENALKSALFKKEILDIFRVRSYRHKNCCNNFLDATCIQDGYLLKDHTVLESLLSWSAEKKMVGCLVEDTGIVVLATEALLSNSSLCRKFCQAQVNTSPILHSEKLIILNVSQEILELFLKWSDSPVIIPKDSILGKYCSNGPTDRVSVITKSIIELRQVMHEFSSMKGMEIDEQFRGVTLDGSNLTFVTFREQILTCVGQICRKLMKFNTEFYFDELAILDQHNMRDELERSVNIAADFVFEFLLEIPVEMASLQSLFEEAITCAFKLFPYCFQLILDGGKNSKYVWCTMIKALDLYNSLLCVGKFKIPDSISDSVKLIHVALKHFESLKVADDLTDQHDYVRDGIRMLLMSLDGKKQDYIFRPGSKRYPDQVFLDANGYWVFAGICSGQKMIYKCLDQRSRRPVIIKKLKKAKLNSATIAKGELGALMTLNSTNIVRYMDCFDDEDHWFMVMEFCEDTVLNYGGDGAPKLDELEIRTIGRQVLLGLYYLHNNHIVHRDIKPSNILKDGRGFIKIADFGEAQLIPATEKREKFDLSSLPGTPAYMAPECLHQAKVHPPADIWSFGCVLLYLVSGKDPWSHLASSLNILYNLATGKDYPADIDGLTCSEEFKQVLKAIFNRNPSERPTVAELLGTPFFHDIPESII